MRDIAPSVREAIEALASDRIHGAACARRWQRALWGRPSRAPACGGGRDGALPLRFLQCPVSLDP
jgi:hypothetical protein